MINIPEKDLMRFAELMKSKIEQIESHPDKPWFDPDGGSGLPQNMQGRVYNGINHFCLSLLCDDKGYKTPVFMTFLQVKEQNAKVKKGECAFPVIFWHFSYKDEDGRKISREEYEQLSKAAQVKCTVSAYSKTYPVFNIEQTTFPEDQPEKWEKLQKKFAAPDLKDEKGMLCCPVLDKMIEDKRWVCPIHLELSDNAFYRPSSDDIHLPLKGQFRSGESFYSTMLHEMGHSTGHESRLDRLKPARFGSHDYGVEELVAEMTAAVSGKALGLPTNLQEENANYLKSWLQAIDTEPKFIFNILSDVGKASNMILGEVDKISRELDVTKSNELYKDNSLGVQTGNGIENKKEELILNI